MNEKEFSALFNKSVNERHQSEKDMLANISSVKGPKYAEFLQAMTDILWMYSKTNQMICGQVPEEVVKQNYQGQGDAIAKLIAIHFSGDKAPVDEFFKMLDTLANNRAALDKEITGLFTKLLKDDSHE